MTPPPPPQLLYPSAIVLDFGINVLILCVCKICTELIADIPCNQMPSGDKLI